MDIKILQFNAIHKDGAKWDMMGVYIDMALCLNRPLYNNDRLSRLKSLFFFEKCVTKR